MESSEIMSEWVDRVSRRFPSKLSATDLHSFTRVVTHLNYCEPTDDHDVSRLSMQPTNEYALLLSCPEV